MVRDQGVGGSNPLSPTNFSITDTEYPYDLAKQRDAEVLQRLLNRIQASMSFLLWERDEARACPLLLARLETSALTLDSTDLLIVAHVAGAVLESCIRVFAQAKELRRVVDWAADVLAKSAGVEFSPLESRIAPCACSFIFRAFTVLLQGP